MKRLKKSDHISHLKIENDPHLLKGGLKRVKVKEPFSLARINPPAPPAIAGQALKGDYFCFLKFSPFR